MPIAFSCPACDRELKLKDELAGKKIRCPGCEKTVNVPDEDEAPDRATRRRSGGKRPASLADAYDIQRNHPGGSAPRGGLGLLIGGGVACVLLLVGLAVGAYFLLHKAADVVSAGGDGPGPKGHNPRVTEKNMRGLRTLMTVEEVEEVFGKGTRQTPAEVEKYLDTLDGRGLFLRGGREIATSYMRWDDGDACVLVGFYKTRYGDRSVSACYAVHVRKGRHQFTVNPFVQPLGDPEVLTEKTEKNREFMRDPQWLRGDAARAALLGKWEAGLGGYEFRADGYCHRDPFDQKGTFRLLDDRRIETDLNNPLDPKQREKKVFHLFVDKTKMYLATVENNDIQSMEGPFQRSGAKPK